MSPEKNQNLGTKINHSGNAPDGMREVPINEFDNTSLQGAVDGGLVGTPDSIPAENGYAPRTELETGSEKKRFTKKQKIIAALSGVALLAGIGGGIAASVANQNQPVAEAPADPSEAPAEPEAPSTPEVPPTAESIEIDGALISDPEALVQEFIANAKTEWSNAGGTMQNAESAYDDDATSVAEYMFEVAAEYDEPYIDALLVDDWESNPRLVEYVERVKTIHKVTVALYAKTIHPELIPEDIEPYKRTSTVKSIDSFITNPDGSVTMLVSTHDFDNSDKNRVGEDLLEEAVNPDNLATPTLTFVIENGKVKLADILRGGF